MALPARPPAASCATSTSALGDAEEAPQAAARQPVGGEDPVLERDQRIEIAALGRANADLGAGAWASVKDIVTGQGSTLISPSPRSATPRPGAVGHPVRAPPAPLRRGRDNTIGGTTGGREIPPSRPLNPFAARRDQRKNATPTAARSNDPAPSRCNSRIGSNTAASLNHRCIAQPPLHRLNHRCIASTTAAPLQPPLHRLNHRCIISTKEPSPS